MVEAAGKIPSGGERMGLLGKGVLAIWNDIASGGEAEFNRWHTREHVPERVGVPGFLRGRRYLASSGTPRFFTLYETETVETLTSPAYVERLNHPTPWSLRVQPSFRNFIRAACRVTASLGQGDGGTLGTVRLGPLPGREEKLRTWLTGTVLPVTVDRPEIVGAHLCETDLSVTRVSTEEQKLRGQQDEAAQWVVLIESTVTEAIDSAFRTHLGQVAFDRQGASSGAAFGVYRLLYSLGR